MRALFILALHVALATSKTLVSTQSSSHVCFDGLGCFSTIPPFDNTDDLLPQSPSHINTAFSLYTRQCDRTPRILHHSDTSPMCGFDSSVPTKIVVHGFLQQGQVPWLREMAQELLKREPMNIITVGWGGGSGFPYSQAVANTRVVAAEISRLLEYLQNTTGITMDRVHIIGHSLGAHIAGYVGNHVDGIGRITGLDPAEPAFKDTDLAVHLDKTDAAFVDIIHTDGSEFDYDSGYGWIKEVGHIDFYPNGGKNQPGCPSRVLTGVISAAYHQGFTDAAQELSCSHSRSIFLFNESINSPCPFFGHPCSNLADLDSNRGNCLRCAGGVCPKMGYDADQTQSRGKFYLRTRPSWPFCGYPQHVEVEFGYMNTTSGSVTVQLDGDGQTSDSIVISSGIQPFQTGDFRRVFFMDQQQVDHVMQVRVTYSSEGRRSWWWYDNDQTSVVIHIVTVTSAKNGRRIHFCGDQGIVHNGNTITLTRSSTDPNECRLLPLPRHDVIFHRRGPL